MQITQEWVEFLAAKYGKRTKEVRDALWPKAKTKSISYLNSVKSLSLEKVILIADVLGCSLDELLRRSYTGVGGFISGDNNQVGNVNINHDVESLQQIIGAQRQIIEHQDKEIERMNANMKAQLKAKDQQIEALNQKNDRLIGMLQDTGNQ